MTASVPMLIVFAQQDFESFSGNPIDNSVIEGTIRSELDDAGNYIDIEICPRGTVEVWTKHDENHLYKAARFTTESNNPWTAFLLGGTACMQTEADDSLFKNDDCD